MPTDGQRNLKRQLVVEATYQTLSRTSVFEIRESLILLKNRPLWHES